MKFKYLSQLFLNHHIKKTFQIIKVIFSTKSNFNSIKNIDTLT